MLLAARLALTEGKLMVGLALNETMESPLSKREPSQPPLDATAAGAAAASLSCWLVQRWRWPQGKALPRLGRAGSALCCGSVERFYG